MDILDAVIERISEQYTNASEDLVSGRVESYADYKYVCGVLHGLLKVKREIEELKRNIEEY
jgi:hypothetical protein